MKKTTTTIFNKAKNLSMTADEKSLILRRVFAAPVPSPVRISIFSRLYNSPAITSLAGYSSGITGKRSRVLVSLGITAVLLGTTSAMAQVALPGDLLYLVKIHINEKARTYAARTDDEKATLEATFATRRLEEARMLAASHKLTASKSEEIATQFEAHATSLEEHLGELKKHGHEEEAKNIKTSFVASVQVQSKVLDSIAATTSLRGTLVRMDPKDEPTGGSGTIAMMPQTASAATLATTSKVATVGPSHAELARKAVYAVRSLPSTAPKKVSLGIAATSTASTSLAVVGSSTITVASSLVSDIVLASSTPKATSTQETNKGGSATTTATTTQVTPPLPVPALPVPPLH